MWVITAMITIINMRITRSDIKWFLFALFLMAALYSQGQNAQSVYNCCKQIGIQHPDIVTAQACVETGNFECLNCSQNVGNIFGFLWKGEYLTFCGWDECCYYYLWWQQQNYKGGDYYAFLRRIHYAGNADKYEKTVRQKLKELNLK
jgi:hypothetical protein